MFLYSKAAKAHTNPTVGCCLHRTVVGYDSDRERERERERESEREMKTSIYCYNPLQISDR